MTRKSTSSVRTPKIRDAAVLMRDDTVALPAGENNRPVGTGTDSDIVD